MTKMLLSAVAASLATTSFPCISAAAAAHAAEPPKAISRSDYLKTLDAQFNQIDANHDGKLSKEELAAELQRELQVANERIAQQMEAKFRQLDTNHDGQLSLQEFMALRPAIHPSEAPEQMLQRLDKNHDGTLTADEFRAPQLAQFDRIDANHDGVVTPAEMQAASGRK